MDNYGRPAKSVHLLLCVQCAHVYMCVRMCAGVRVRMFLFIFKRYLENVSYVLMLIFSAAESPLAELTTAKVDDITINVTVKFNQPSTFQSSYDSAILTCYDKVSGHELEYKKLTRLILSHGTLVKVT